MSIHLGRSLLLVLSLLVPTSLAQDSTLTVNFEGTVADGGELIIKVEDALDNVAVFLVVGPELGQTCFDLFTEQICLGVAFPALIVPIGDTDGAGNLSVVVDLPPASAIAGGGPLHFQAVTVRIESEGGFSLPTIQTRVSNVETETFE